MSEYEDIEFTGQAPREHEGETVGEGDTILTFLGCKTAEKPAWKLERDRAKDGEEVDTHQWQWDFEVSEGEFEGFKLTDWTNRTWHEKSTAGKYAAALAGLEKYDKAAMIAKGYPSVKTLENFRLKAFIQEVQGKDEVWRNYIKNPRPVTSGRPRPAKGTQAEPTPLVPRRELPSDIFEDANA